MHGVKRDEHNRTLNGSLGRKTILKRFVGMNTLTYFAILLLISVIYTLILSMTFKPDDIVSKAIMDDVTPASSFIPGKNIGMKSVNITKIINTDTREKTNFIDFKFARRWKMKENIMDTKGCINNGREDLEWEHRAPYALIVGAQKAGSTAFYEYLGQHPHVLDIGKSEVHFYDVTFDTRNGPDIVTDKGIDREKAFQLYKRRLLSKGESRKTIKENPKKTAIDKTPAYLFFSDRIPNRVLCVTPWVKVLAILRNPVDRAFSQYNMKRKYDRKATITFEDWIKRDIQNMKDTGVLQDKVPPSDFIDSKMEDDAWKTYIRLDEDFPVGRGLYSIQLRQWIRAFKDAGKSIDDMLVVKNEEMDKDPERVYNQALNFLGFPDGHLKSTRNRNVGNYTSSLKESTRSMLEELYTPYNEDLYKLLGPTWVGAWD